MYTEDDFSKFTKHLSKYIGEQWSKLKSSSSSSQSEKDMDHIDQQLEQEYETLLREIDYLAAEKSCYLSFVNDNFHKARSSEDLSKILQKHSSEVLKNYLKEHDKEVKHGNFTNRQDLISYVTEIVVSTNKVCNNKLCSCKPIKVSKEVFTDSSVPPENGKETQTDSPNNPVEKATNVKPEITQMANQTTSNHGLKKSTATVQTDDWSHDPNCKCGCCPKTGSKIDTKSVTTVEKPIQDATTSDKKIAESKNVSANCVGETTATNTSQRLCVPANFEKLIETKQTNQNFSCCPEMRDCACDAYDVKEALKRGLVLPSSDICIQKKKVKIIKESKKEKKKQTKKDKKKNKDFSDEKETSDEGSSINNYVKEEADKNQKKENKDEKKETKDSEYSSSSPRETPKKKKEGTTGCFGCKGSKRDNLDKSGQNRSMQTSATRTLDKNEGACFCDEKDQSAQTSAVSGVATQVSTRPSKKEFQNSEDDETLSISEKKSKGKFWSKGAKRENKENLSNTLDNEISSRREKEDIDDSPNKEIKGSISKDAQFRFGKDQDNQNKNLRDKDNKDKDSREKVKNGVCSRCGRLKRDCVSACRNTIIIPSNRALPTGETESLRMLIKVQSRETNRQIDSIITELNHQRNEVRRLNDMYQKMMENFYEMHGRNPSQSKQPSDLSRDCRCSNFSTSRKFDSAKECGCSVSNECKIGRKQDTPSARGHQNSETNNIKLRRFGPPNTAVAINRCDICNVEVTGNDVRASIVSKENSHHDGDKQRKDELNHSKKAGSSRQTLSTRQENIPSGGTGDCSLPKADSISTLYKNKTPLDDQINRSNGYENLLDEKYEYIIESKEPDSAENDDIIKIETDSTKPEKEPTGLFSSRILIWFKKSWVSIKHRTKECRNREKKRRKEQAFNCMLKFCQQKAKQAATGMWKASKNAMQDFLAEEVNSKN